jgi:hypothetical protein
MKIDYLLTLIAALALSVSARGLSAAQTSHVGGEMMQTQSTVSVSGLHDFDFLVGHWQVHHRRLKERLADNHEWIEFEGSSVVRKILGGSGISDDNMLEFPGGTYRAAGMKSFDAKSGQWSIWWLDGRTPLGPLDPPVRGGFRDGTGTFFADEVLNGRPIRVRFTWSAITPTSCHWEQAFSVDGGATWETNWVMDFRRIP